MKNFIYLCATMVACLWLFSKCTISERETRVKPNASKFSRDADQMGTAAGKGIADYLNSMSAPKK